MFAVPGWSVSADSLKAETVAPSNAAPGTKSRKRKRAGGGANKDVENVTSSNVADLWGSVVEGKPAEAARGSKPEPVAKKQKKGDQDKKTEKPAKKQLQDDTAGDRSEQQPSSKKDKKSKNKNKPKVADSAVESEPLETAVASATPPLPPAPPKLTPLQASMRQKLISARFRHLNETLYTRPSAESFDLFTSDPTMFGEYHEGFRQQVKVWPENPVDSFLKDLRSRGRARPAGKGDRGARDWRKSALPRTQGTCVVADLGCGDARLAQELQSDKAKLRFDVRSYDLQSPSPLVTKADIANLPLEDGSVNVAIFCLALMGTNWIDFVEEAYRILHWKGELWVAEIKSRFGPVRNKHAPVGHSVGNRKKAAAAGKKGKADENEDNDEDLAVEVDGADDRRKETDVSAFVEALKKRGFVLQGERNEAVDLSNKMFVKMHFIKGVAPTKGKGVKEAEARRPPSKGMQKWRLQVQEDEEDDGKNEAAILKPCVYKIR